MKIEQVKNSGLLVLSNLLVNFSNFLRQVILAWFLGISEQIDVLLIAQIIPTIIQAVIGGGAGETSVIKGGDLVKEKKSFMSIFIFLCLILVLILGGIYYLTLNKFVLFFNVSPDNTDLFRKLSLIYIMNMIPGTFTSILRPHLYSKGYYKFFTYSSVISQLAGLIFILLSLRLLGIYSFALSLCLANILNAIWFSFRAEMNYADILRKKVWKTELKYLLVLFQRVFSVSLQTILNYIGIFWERTLSMRYLSGGYLSSLNYSKNLSDLPGTVLLSSILTTSYIEQVNLYKKDTNLFNKYTTDSLNFILRIGFFFQILLLGFAPLIVIVLFRRGNFDNKAVESTLIIFNILTVGFLPKLLYGYFARTMYILGDYKHLLVAGFLRVILQLSIMMVFVKVVTNAIPFAILSGNVFIALLLYYFVGIKLKINNWIKFPAQVFIVIISSLIMYKIHSITLQYYLYESTSRIIIIYTPFILITFLIIGFWTFRSANGKLILEIIHKYVKKRS
jgi:putative peptidoglycan lipid II flippase